MGRKRLPKFQRIEEIPVELLRECFDYYPVSGTIRRSITTSPNAVKGDLVGWYDSIGYGRVSFCGKAVLLHRLVWAYMTGRWPHLTIDHVDGDPSNNRWVNLRQVTHSMNCRNSKAKGGNGGYPGVYKEPRSKKNPYFSQIRVEGRNIRLGAFPTAELAYQAWLEAKTVYHPGHTERNAFLGANN